MTKTDVHFNWCVLVGLCLGFMKCSVTRFPSEKLSGMVVAQEFYIAPTVTHVI